MYTVENDYVSIVKYNKPANIASRHTDDCTASKSHVKRNKHLSCKMWNVTVPVDRLKSVGWQSSEGHECQDNECDSSHYI